MLNIKILQWLSGFLLINVISSAVLAYELPPPEKRSAHAKDLSIHNAMFLRNNTRASVIGILKQQGKRYELVESETGRAMGLPIEVNPAIQIDPDLLGQKVKITGRMTYQSLSMPDSGSIEPAYSFNFELYAIEAVK